MKIVTDLLPVLVFFVVFKLADANLQTAQSILAGWGEIKPALVSISLATLSAIAVTLLQVIWQIKKKGRADKGLLISLALIVIFGGATLFLQDDAFIKWKPTVFYWIMAAALLGGQLFGKNFIQTLMSKEIHLAPRVWHIINWQWIGFFVVMGVLNLYVAHHYSTSTWVTYKLVGGFGLMIVFALAQSIFISRHLEKT